MGLLGPAIASGFVIYALRENMQHFISPSDIALGKAPQGHRFRLGGVVLEGSVQRSSTSLDVDFVVTDRFKNFPVRYTGILPDLFREGQSVVATGTLDAVVSLIQSNFRGFGSGMVPDGLGFMLQDRGQLFTLEPGQANTYGPHKRPFHTIIPAFVTKDGKPWMSFGVMGGSFQPLGHVEILMNLIDFGMNAQEAGDAPRIDHQCSSEPTGEKMKDSGQITLENGIPYETIRALLQMGHRVGWAAPGVYGGYQAIRFDASSKVYFGASDARKDGQAAGY